tara:strand:- start:553 stop:777 length:225 start_codon:yes stop_codon:yes gene_type:complete
MTKPFWDKKWGKTKKCAITRTRLRPGKDKDGKTYVIELPCGHFFYRKALFAWFDKNTDHLCPLCRKEVDLKNIQ